MFACFVAPLFTACFLVSKFRELSTPAFESMYGSLTENLRLDSYWALMYIPFNLIRRLVFCILAVLTVEEHTVQTNTIVFLNLAMLMYIAGVKPFEDPRMVK